MNEDSAASLYLKRIADRDTYLDEAFRSATVTIPSVVPDMQDICVRSTPVVLKKPFQSLGARGVNNLASKLLLTLFPPTMPFMKYVLAGEARDDAAEEGVDISELKSLLARREGRIQDEVDIQNIRNKIFLAIRSLLVAGNTLVYMDPSEGGMRIFPLNAYTTVRDGSGNLLDLIYVEKLDKTSIVDERVLEILRTDPSAVAPPDAPGSGGSDQPVLLYTRVVREGKKYKSWQEVGNTKVAGTEETWALDALPWLALRFTGLDGEDYGRGFVEEYRGDLTSYEQLSRDTQFASANAAKVVWAIRPTSVLRPKKFMDAPNGGAISADPDDIMAIRLDKGGDMQFVGVEKQGLAQALSAAFMLNSSFQRQQERVTAEEIRRMAEELEDTLGGVFSLLSTELQLPVARLLETGLIKRDPSFGSLPKGQTRIGVVTGLAAIGRGQELQRLREAVALIAEVAQSIPGIVDYIKEGPLNTRLWTGTGVDTDGLLRTEEEVAEMRQAKLQQNAQRVAGEEAARGAGNALGQIDPEVAQAGLVGAVTGEEPEQ